MSNTQCYMLHLEMKKPLSTLDIAKLAGITRMHAYRLAPQIPGAVRARDGAAWRFPDSPELRRWIKSRKERGGGSDSRSPLWSEALDRGIVIFKRKTRLTNADVDYFRYKLDHMIRVSLELGGDGEKQIADVIADFKWQRRQSQMSSTLQRGIAGIPKMNRRAFRN